MDIALIILVCWLTPSIPDMWEKWCDSRLRIEEEKTKQLELQKQQDQTDSQE